MTFLNALNARIDTFYDRWIQEPAPAVSGSWLPRAVLMLAFLLLALTALAALGGALIEAAWRAHLLPVPEWSAFWTGIALLDIVGLLLVAAKMKSRSAAQ